MGNVCDKNSVVNNECVMLHDYCAFTVNGVCMGIRLSGMWCDRFWGFYLSVLGGVYWVGGGNGLCLVGCLLLVDKKFFFVVSLVLLRWLWRLSFFCRVRRFFWCFREKIFISKFKRSVVQVFDKSGGVLGNKVKQGIMKNWWDEVSPLKSVIVKNRWRFSYCSGFFGYKNVLGGICCFVVGKFGKYGKYGKRGGVRVPCRVGRRKSVFYTGNAIGALFPLYVLRNYWWGAFGRLFEFFWVVWGGKSSVGYAVGFLDWFDFLRVRMFRFRYFNRFTKHIMSFMSFPVGLVYSRFCFLNVFFNEFLRVVVGECLPFFFRLFWFNTLLVYGNCWGVKWLQVHVSVRGMWELNAGVVFRFFRLKVKQQFMLVQLLRPLFRSFLVSRRGGTRFYGKLRRRSVGVKKWLLRVGYWSCFFVRYVRVLLRVWSIERVVLKVWRGKASLWGIRVGGLCRFDNGVLFVGLQATLSGRLRKRQRAFYLLERFGKSQYWLLPRCGVCLKGFRVLRYGVCGIRLWLFVRGMFFGKEYKSGF